MRLRTFFANDGDCLLLTSDAGKNVLVDGGHYANTFRRCTLPSLLELPGRKQKLDLVIVTHIDADHIVGILDLLDHYKAVERTDARRPAALESAYDSALPTIAALWHNSWADQVGTDLAARLGVLDPGTSPQQLDIPTHPYTHIWRARSTDGTASDFTRQVESKDQGSSLIQMVDTQIPSIIRNAGFPDDLVHLTDPAYTMSIGPALSLTVLGPSEASLQALKDFWTADLPKEERSARRERKHAEINYFVEQRSDPNPRPRRAVSIAPNPRSLSSDSELGDDRRVTIPNRASIIALAEEKSGTKNTATVRRCLLTGDAAADDILEGLRATDKLKKGTFLCDILKVQHHGAEFNFSADFAETVIANHYVLSANGLHKNPDPRVIRMLVDGRTKDPAAVPFTLWFNCGPGKRISDDGRASMEAALEMALKKASEINSGRPGLMTIRVLKDSAHFFDICLCSRRRSATCTCVPADVATTVLTKTT
jgi:hypothetical protein